MRGRVASGIFRKGDENGFRLNHKKKNKHRYLDNRHQMEHMQSTSSYQLH
jgi:hypothetical protein